MSDYLIVGVILLSVEKASWAMACLLSLRHILALNFVGCLQSQISTTITKIQTIGILIDLIMKLYNVYETVC